MPAVLEHDPDIILPMAGTNDFFFYRTDPNDPTHGCNATTGIRRMRDLLTSIFLTAPTTHILLSGVTYVLSRHMHLPYGCYCLRLFRSKR